VVGAAGAGLAELAEGDEVAAGFGERIPCVSKRVPASAIFSSEVHGVSMLATNDEFCQKR
jgi:hypothetical protein